MKPFLLFCFTFLAANAQGKGCTGTYFISGTAYGIDNSVLKNERLTVKMGQKTFTVMVDSNGHFEMEIPWENPCRSASGPNEAERLNPPVILISFQDKEIKLNNRWKKYNNCSYKPREEVTWKQDLRFG